MTEVAESSFKMVRISVAEYDCTLCLLEQGGVSSAVLKSYEFKRWHNALSIYV